MVSGRTSQGAAKGLSVKDGLGRFHFSRVTLILAAAISRMTLEVKLETVKILILEAGASKSIAMVMAKKRKKS